VTQPSPLYRLLEERLGEPLAEFVAAQRATRSWREIATDLGERTGIAVNAETLRLWLASRIVTETRVA
jgi:hypothetical protein